MKKGYIYIFLAAISFSTMEIAGKLIATDVNPFQLTFLRFLIGGLVLLPLAIRHIREKKLTFNKNDWLYFIWTGFLCVIISMTFFQLAIVYTKASTVAILFSTNPIFTIPFAVLLLNEKMTKRTTISLMISFIGIICILNPTNLGSDLGGIILAILAAVTFSMYSVIAKMRSKKYGDIVLNSFTFLVGDVLLLICILVSHISYLANYFKECNLNSFSNISVLQGINGHNIFAILYLGVIVTGLGYLLFFLAMEETSVTTASIVFFIKPALAPILSFIILKEIIPINTLVGIFFILIGSLIILVNKKNKSIINK